MQLNTNRYKQKQTDTVGHKQLQTNTDRYKQMQAITNRHKQMQAIKNKYEQSQLNTNRCKQIQTDSNRYVCLSLLQPQMSPTRHSSMSAGRPIQCRPAGIRSGRPIPCRPSRTAKRRCKPAACTCCRSACTRPSASDRGDALPMSSLLGLLRLLRLELVLLGRIAPAASNRAPSTPTTSKGNGR
jgi:hypothetical protein